MRQTAAWVLLLALSSVIPAFAQGRPSTEPEALDDTKFIESLADRYSTVPVDRERLSRLFFSLASTLDGGKTTVRFLQSRLPTRELAREQINTTAKGQYNAYAAYVDRFKQSVTRLLDDPLSGGRLFRVMMDGERTCWQLDRYSRLLETYGVDASDLMSMLSSTEACERFRRAAFQPRVEAIVADALSTDAAQKAKIRELREELNHLETLVDDLRQIEDDGP